MGAPQTDLDLVRLPQLTIADPDDSFFPSSQTLPGIGRLVEPDGAGARGAVRRHGSRGEGRGKARARGSCRSCREEGRGRGRGRRGRGLPEGSPLLAWTTRATPAATRISARKPTGPPRRRRRGACVWAGGFAWSGWPPRRPRQRAEASDRARRARGRSLTARAFTHGRRRSGVPCTPARRHREPGSSWVASGGAIGFRAGELIAAWTHGAWPQVRPQGWDTPQTRPHRRQRKMTAGVDRDGPSRPRPSGDTGVDEAC